MVCWPGLRFLSSNVVVGTTVYSLVLPSAKTCRWSRRESVGPSCTLEVNFNANGTATFARLAGSMNAQLRLAAAAATTGAAARTACDAADQHRQQHDQAPCSDT